ncbi:MAG: 1-acyl-sn-glycerol-3-phosphate acyltransferase [Solirubrobacteraceae bacterium]
MLKKFIAFFFLIGFKKIRIDSNKIKGTVMICAPHTSNWDFPNAISYFWHVGLDIKFLIKDDYIKSFWLGWLIKWMGGIGVDRSQKNDLVTYSSNLFKENPDLILLITAEGTRAKSSKWKLGFYHIALKANVPISLAFMDWEKKELGINKIVYPNQKEKKELFKEIEEFYADKKGKFPENFTSNIE